MRSHDPRVGRCVLAVVRGRGSDALRPKRGTRAGSVRRHVRQSQSDGGSCSGEDGSPAEGLGPGRTGALYCGPGGPAPLD